MEVAHVYSALEMAADDDGDVSARTLAKKAKIERKFAKREK